MAIVIMCILLILAIWILAETAISYKIYKRLTDLQKAIIRKSFTTNNGTVYFTHKGLNINVFHSAKILTDERMFRIWSEFKISVFNEQEIEKYNDNVFMLTCYILKRKEECL